MKKFRCVKCQHSYGWVLQSNDETVCVYCAGKYPDGTPVSGGKK